MTTKYHFDNVYLSNPVEFEDIYIYQIGKRFCDKGEVIDSHMQSNLFELTIVKNGSGVVYSNGIGTKVLSGDIYLSLPFDEHKIVSNNEKSLEYDYIAFVVKNETYSNDFGDIIKKITAKKRVFKDSFLELLIRSSLLEFGTNEIYSYELLSSIFRQMLIRIIRRFLCVGNIEKNVENFNSAKFLCYRMMNYIESNIYTLKNLDELSVYMGYSYNYLSKTFSKTTSTTLKDFFREKKMSLAKQLILEGEMSITEISEKLNYSSMYAFSKSFKKCYGVSPKMFQKSKKGS